MRILMRVALAGAMLVFIAPWLAGIWATGILVALGLGASDHAATAWGMFAVPVWFLLGGLITRWGPAMLGPATPASAGRQGRDA